MAVFSGYSWDFGYRPSAFVQHAGQLDRDLPPADLHAERLEVPERLPLSRPLAFARIALHGFALHADWSLSAFTVRHWGLAQACAWSSVININIFTGAGDMRTETRIGDWRITLNRSDGHGLVSEVWRRRRAAQSDEALKGADSD